MVLAPALDCHRQLEPFLGDTKPRLFIERAYRFGCLLCGFLGLLTKLGGVVGHAFVLADRPTLLKRGYGSTGRSQKVQ